jgi:hypothetical protein
MNQEQILGQVRTYLAVLLGYWGAKHIDPELLKMLGPDFSLFIATLILGLPSAIWSWYSKRAPALAKQAMVVLQDHPILATQVSSALAPALADGQKQ